MVRPTQEREVRVLTDVESLSIGDGTDTGDGGVDFDGGGGTGGGSGSGVITPPAAEIVHVVDDAGSDLDIDFDVANWWDITLTEDVTFTISNPPGAGTIGLLHIILRQGTGAPWLVTWPSEVEWPTVDGLIGGTPAVLHTDENARDVVTLITEDAGTSYGGNHDTADSTGNFLTSDTGEQHVINSHGTLGATETLDLSTGNVQTGTLNANCTITLTGFTAGVRSIMQVRLTEDGTGGWTPTFSVAGTLTWLGGSAPAHTTTAATITEYVFWSDDGGTIVNGGQLGATASLSFATPAIVLGSAAAAGAASTVIRSDSTIVAFDTTPPVTQAYSDVAATGSAAFAARRDHVHGMPAGSTGSVGELLINDTPAGSPLVFSDILQNEDQTDLVYADPLP